MPRLEDLFSTLSGGQFFTKLDLSQAYQQVLLEENAKQYLTINTHRGLFQYTRLPFGVSSAPSIFQRIMDSLLQGLKQVCVYLDDILITGKTKEEHLRNLEEVLKRLQQAGLRLKRKKCQFLQPSVQYLGYKIDKKGLHPTEEKVKAIKEAPRPKNVGELRSYLGLINGKFLKDLSTMLAPLYRLLKKETQWHWGEEQEQSFNESKRWLHSERVLAHYDPQKDLVLCCDASHYGLGAVLCHRLEQDTDKPIGYASRTLTSAEQNYSQLEKEGLAVIFGVKHFHQYLYGRSFTIVTDHQPLLGLMGEKKGVSSMAAARIQRWTMFLSAYQYQLIYRPGRENSNADALSRLPLEQETEEEGLPEEVIFTFKTLATTPVKAAHIALLTGRDPILSRVRNFVLRGWPGDTRQEIELQPYYRRRCELSVVDGCLLWGSRVVIPPSVREIILKELHTGHPGIARMRSLGRSYVWWPSMDKQIEEMIQRCPQCQQYRNPPPEAPLHPWEWPDRPWSRLHLDFAGPFLGKMYLLVIDAHSKWLEVCPMTTTTSYATIEKLRSLFAAQGLPETVVTDNGANFTSEEFKTYMAENGITLIHTAPYHPASNGLVERAVQTFKAALRRMQKEEGSLEAKLARFLFSYRATPQATTGVSPGELLMGRRLRSRLDLLHPDLVEKVRTKQQGQKTLHDRRSRERLFSVGQRVYVQNFGTGVPWLMGKIQERTGPVSFRVRLDDGRIFRRHQDHLRKCFVENDPANSSSNESDDIEPATPATALEGNTNSDQVREPQGSTNSGDSGTNDSQRVGNDTVSGNQDSAPKPTTPTRPETPTIRRSGRARKEPARLDL